jgi:hypothetical protein
MAKKKSPAKKTAAGKTPKTLTPRQVHKRVSALLGGKALKGKIAEAFAAEEFAAAAAARVAADIAVKPVSFTCSNIGCLVSIQPFRWRCFQVDAIVGGPQHSMQSMPYLGCHELKHLKNFETLL